MTEIREILAERGAKYGDFKEQAYLSNLLRDEWNGHKTGLGYKSENLYPFMVEGLTMIFHKLARLGNGTAFHIDSWRDIAGYATLVADELERMDEKSDYSGGVSNENNKCCNKAKLSY